MGRKFISYLIGLYVAYTLFIKIMRLLFHGPPRDKNDKMKNILVTGCDSGFGKMFTQRMMGKGYTVYAACYSKSGAENLVTETGGKVRVFVMDVTSERSVANGLKFVTKDLENHDAKKQLWAIVNNAGVSPCSVPQDWLTPKDYLDVFQVNVLGAVRVTKAFLPLVKAAKGRVINMSSMAGHIVLPNMSPYAVSKYGMQALSDGLRVEAKAFGVTVHIIEPTMFKTPMTNIDRNLDNIQAVFDEQPKEVKQEYGQDYVDQMKMNTEKVLGNVNPNSCLVIDAYEHAATAKFPQTRYKVGVTSSTTLLVSACPTWLRDWLISRMMRTPTPAAYK